MIGYCYFLLGKINLLCAQKKYAKLAVEPSYFYVKGSKKNLSYQQLAGIDDFRFIHRKVM